MEVEAFGVGGELVDDLLDDTIRDARVGNLQGVAFLEEVVPRAVQPVAIAHVLHFLRVFVRVLQDLTVLCQFILKIKDILNALIAFFTIIIVIRMIRNKALLG